MPGSVTKASTLLGAVNQASAQHLLSVFAVVAGIRSLCARFSIIPDCDEGNYNSQYVVISVD